MKKRLWAMIIVVSLISACGGGERATNAPGPTGVARATHMPESAVPLRDACADGDPLAAGPYGAPHIYFDP